MNQTATPTQAEFIEGVLALITSSPKLFAMFTMKGTGKTIAIEMLTTILEQEGLENELKRRVQENGRAGIYKTTSAVLNEFSVEFRDRFASRRDPLARKIVETLVREESPYQIIELLVGVVDQAQELNRTIIYNSRGTSLIIPLNGQDHEKTH